MFRLLRDHRFARRYFFAHAQSALGDQLAYIGLVVVAQKTWGSPIMLSVVLMADLLPSALFGSWFGALADHRSRRMICVTADIARAIAFGAVVIFDASAWLLAAALIAGLGTAAFGPASLSALPTLTTTDQQVGALSLHGLISSTLTIAGPFVAAGILFLASPDALFTINAASFLISSAALMAIPKAAWGGQRSKARRKLTRARLADYPREARMNVLTTAALALFGGMVGIAEVVLALEVLETSAAGLAILIAAFGVGFAAAYALTARLTELDAQRKRFLAGAAILSTGLVLIAVAPTIWVALPMFAIAGLGNGLAVASARLILQQTVDAERLGGIYGIKDSFDASAVAASLLGAGLLVALLGARVVFVVAAIGCGLTALSIARGIRRVRLAPSSALPDG